MTEEQLKTFLLAELKPFVNKVFWDSDGMWVSGKNSTYLAYYMHDVSVAKPGLYIAKFLNDNASVVDDNGELYWGSWPEELKVSLDDDDEIHRRVYNIIKRLKEIKNKERMKKIQKDF